MSTSFSSLVDAMVAADDHLDELLAARERAMEDGRPGPRPEDIVAAERRLAAAREAYHSATRRPGR